MISMSAGCFFTSHCSSLLDGLLDHSRIHSDTHNRRHGFTVVGLKSMNCKPSLSYMAEIKQLARWLAKLIIIHIGTCEVNGIACVTNGSNSWQLRTVGLDTLKHGSVFVVV